MIDAIRNVYSLMDELSGVTSPTDVYMIGGGALIFNGAKAVTKDVDLVVRTREAFDRVAGALACIGFRQTRPDAGCAREHPSGIYERDDGIRVDMFETVVCGRLSLSDGMASRAVPAYSSGNVHLLVCSPTDILVFKSVTGRDGDQQDSAGIVESGTVDWDAALDEIRAQTADGEEVWITWIADSLFALGERYGYRIPIMRELLGMADAYLERWEGEMEAKAWELEGKRIPAPPQE
ncbi:MAG: hypothetical protein Q4Q58_01330 [Thermoplasmata archaeon]|nr:hypothetical protein [Thermoplasmata archaeon]